jgi:hypothetical protein
MKIPGHKGRHDDVETGWSGKNFCRISGFVAGSQGLYSIKKIELKFKMTNPPKNWRTRMS